MRTGSLFSGYAGLDLAVNEYFGSTTAWHCEFDKHPSAILKHHYPDVPNYGDVTTIDWESVEPIDILTGGFPCQDVSVAGRRAGIAEGTRSGLWSYMSEAIDALRPKYVVIENVRGLLSAAAHRPMEPGTDDLGEGTNRPVLRAIGAVLGQLWESGYGSQWVTLPASEVGACHRRERVFILAVREDVKDIPVSGMFTGVVSPRIPGLLNDVAVNELLPTPTTQDGANNGGPAQHRRNSKPLNVVATLLPTPTLSDVKTPVAEEKRRAGGHTVNLADATVGNSWGKYAAAIMRAELALGRPAPSPTELSRNNVPRLSPAFAEWMMMLPEGWVTDPDIGIPRSGQLKAIGNGVCPPQAFRALELLCAMACEEVA